MNHIFDAPRTAGANSPLDRNLQLPPPFSGGRIIAAAAAYAPALSGGGVDEAAWRASLTCLSAGGVTSFAPQPFQQTAPTTPVKKKGFFSKLGGALKKFVKSNLGKIALIGGAVAAAAFVPGVGAVLGKAFSLIGRAGGAAGVIGRGGATNFLRDALSAFVKRHVISNFDLSDAKGTLENFLPANVFNRETLTSAANALLKQFGLGDSPVAAGLRTLLGKLGARSGAAGDLLRTVLLSANAARGPQA